MFEKAKGLKICKTVLKKILELGNVYKLMKKMYLVSHCHIKKNAVKFDIFLFNK